ncbi:ABC transporter substrate-binding protein [Haematospirillum jordaniae]|uniref:ABC transporter substrate-binding protein n=1 Tax=Haematospirillum jordaniae TaxID=1549855 RepID=UPI002AC36B0C|nr:ABC transporter substrate-binding protein [Haematospirillum jordaniae]
MGRTLSACMIFSAIALCLTNDGWASEIKYVASTAIVEHPALNAIRDGLRDGLRNKGYDDSTLKFTFESAQGSPATAAQIARKLAGAGPDVIVPITTPSAQAVVASSNHIPVVFSAISDPVGANLVQDLDKPSATVTGIADIPDFGKSLAMVKAIVPSVQTIGIPHNPGEPNAVDALARIRAAANITGIKIIATTAHRSSDVQAAAQALVGKVDAIYIPLDNTVVSALESVLKVGIDNRIPVFATDTHSVERGSVAALGYDQYDIGLQTADIVDKILKGARVSDIPVAMPRLVQLYVNARAAEQMGVNIPQDVLKQAAHVVR